MRPTLFSIGIKTLFACTAMFVVIDQAQAGSCPKDQLLAKPRQIEDKAEAGLKRETLSLVKLEGWRGGFAVEGVTYLEQGYVGRRWLERSLARAFSQGERLVVLHGLGGIGKSTLASRFLERRLAEGARVLTFYAGRELSADGLVEEVAERLAVKREAGLPPVEAEKAFHSVLAQALRAEPRTFLLLDNFEDHQQPDGSLRDPALGKALLLLLRLGGEALQLLLTTRRALRLPPGPVAPLPLSVGELSPAGRRKLRALDPRGLGALDDDAWNQAQEAFGGHPKALQLLGLYLRANRHRARRLVERLAEVRAHVEEALGTEEQEHGRQLLVGELLEEVPAQLLPAFDRLCLLSVPVPAEELEALLEAERCEEPGEALAWLRERGLLGATLAPGLGTEGEQVHRLLADPRREALRLRESEAVARAWHLRLAAHFRDRPGPLSDLGLAAGHLDAAGERAGALLLYDRWALRLRNRHAYGASALVAREGLARFAPSAAEAERAAAANLWLSIADAAESLGEIESQRDALAAAENAVGEGSGPEVREVRGSHALRLGGRRRLGGDMPGAEECFRRAAQLFGSLGNAAERDRAIALGGLADVLFARGELDEALRIRREEQLPVYERLGDVRSRAVTLGRIALILRAKGELEEARRLQEERLAVNRRLGDLDGIAWTQFELALLDLGEGKPEAQERLEEAARLFARLGSAAGLSALRRLMEAMAPPGEEPGEG